jgi:hypothetical protein
VRSLLNCMSRCTNAKPSAGVPAGPEAEPLEAEPPSAVPAPSVFRRLFDRKNRGAAGPEAAAAPVMATAAATVPPAAPDADAAAKVVVPACAAAATGPKALEGLLSFAHPLGRPSAVSSDTSAAVETQAKAGLRLSFRLRRPDHRSPAAAPIGPGPDGVPSRQAGGSGFGKLLARCRARAEPAPAFCHTSRALREVYACHERPSSLCCWMSCPPSSAPPIERVLHRLQA